MYARTRARSSVHSYAQADDASHDSPSRYLMATRYMRHYVAQLHSTCARVRVLHVRVLRARACARDRS